MDKIITAEQIAAGAAVLNDDGKPVGRNTAVMVWDAMSGASTSGDAPADLQQLKVLALAKVRAWVGAESTHERNISAGGPGVADQCDKAENAALNVIDDLIARIERSDAAKTRAYENGVEDGKRMAASIERAAAPAPSEPTEISGHLRQRAAGAMPNQDDAKLMLAAADECDRFYGGMMNWKANAQAKDRTIIELRAASVATASGDELPPLPDYTISFCSIFGAKPDRYWSEKRMREYARAAVSAATKPTADCEQCGTRLPLHLLTCPVAVKGMAEGKKKEAPEPLRQLLVDLSNNTYFCGLHLGDDAKYAGYLRDAEAAEQAIIEYVQSLLATKPAAPADEQAQAAPLEHPDKIAAKITVMLRADSGYMADQEARISANQWGKICAILAGKAATPMASADAVIEAREQALIDSEDAIDQVIQELEGDAANQSGAYSCRTAIRALRTQAAGAEGAE